MDDEDREFLASKTPQEATLFFSEMLVSLSERGLKDWYCGLASAGLYCEAKGTDRPIAALLDIRKPGAPDAQKIGSPDELAGMWLRHSKAIFDGVVPFNQLSTFDNQLVYHEETLDEAVNVMIGVLARANGEYGALDTLATMAEFELRRRGLGDWTSQHSLATQFQRARAQRRPAIRRSKGEWVLVVGIALFLIALALSIFAQLRKG
ncbi:MAG TPA: hypothetical protein VH518_00370 [Tepidisphaeraceae bacterium]|jgi:hypothetical protein